MQCVARCDTDAGEGVDCGVSHVGVLVTRHIWQNCSFFLRCFDSHEGFGMRIVVMMAGSGHKRFVCLPLGASVRGSIAIMLSSGYMWMGDQAPQNHLAISCRLLGHEEPRLMCAIQGDVENS